MLTSYSRSDLIWSVKEGHRDSPSLPCKPFPDHRDIKFIYKLLKKNYKLCCDLMGDVPLFPELFISLSIVLRLWLLRLPRQQVVFAR